MEKYNKRDAQGRLIDGILPENDGDRWLYRIVIDREIVDYKPNKEEAFVALNDLLEARDEGRLQEAIENLRK